MPPLPPMTRVTDGDPPEYMTSDERARVRLAAIRVGRIYPEPVAAVLSRELFAWEQFGWRLAPDALITKLVDHILEQVEAAA